MDAFIHTLLTMTLAASVAAAVVMILRLLFKNLPRRIVCLLWLVVALRMVCPVGMFHLPVSLMPQAVSQGTVVQRVLPQTAPTAATPESPALTNPTAPATQPVPTPETQAPASHGPQVSTILFTLWAVDAAGMALWAVLSYLRLKQRTDEAILVAGNVYESDLIDSPFVCGLVRPKIYLPLGLEEPHRRYVLLHENVHIRRRDYLTKPLAYVLLCLHWFNPVLWLAYRLFCRDVETACDQAVTRDFAREDVAGYAAALLHLGRRTALPAAIPLAFGEENPKNRIKEVLDYNTPKFWVVVFAVALAVFLGLLLLADPPSRADQLDGVIVDDVAVIDHGLTFSLPEDLQNQLLALLADHPRGDYTDVTDPYTPADGDIQLVSHAHTGTTFYLTEAGTFIRENEDTYAQNPQRTAVPEGLTDDPAYTAWRKEVVHYLTTGRAEELYALKTPYVGNHVEVGKILRALRIQEIFGDYTLELHTKEEPYGMTIHFEKDPLPFLQFIGRQADYSVPCVPASELLLALVDNLSYVQWGDPSGIFSSYMTYLEPDGAECASSLTGPVADSYEYQNGQLCALGNADVSPGFISTDLAFYLKSAGAYLADAAIVPQAFSVTADQVTYISPAMAGGDLDVRTRSYAGSTFTISRDLFSVTMTNLLSSAQPRTLTIEKPRYIRQDSLNGQTAAPIFPAEVAGLKLASNGSPYQIQNDKGNATGYWLYLMPDPVSNQICWYLAYATPTGSQDGDPLEALFLLMPELAIAEGG